MRIWTSRSYLLSFSCTWALLLFFCSDASGRGACDAPGQPMPASRAAASRPYERTTYPRLTQVVEQTIAWHFERGDKKFKSLDDFANSIPVSPQYRTSNGLFVTLSKNGKTRGCWGTVDPIQTDLVKATVYATENALTKEYRFSRIRRGEYKLLKPQVTVIRGMQPLPSGSRQNPLKYGLLVRSGGKGAVMLPGEARDGHYQIVQCKLKAGIQPSEPYQMYRIVADVHI